MSSKFGIDITILRIGKIIIFLVLLFYLFIYLFIYLLGRLTW